MAMYLSVVIAQRFVADACIMKLRKDEMTRSWCTVQETRHLSQVNSAGNSKNPMQKSATASDMIKLFAVVRSRRLVVMSQTTSALPITASAVGNQPITQNHACILAIYCFPCFFFNSREVRVIYAPQNQLFRGFEIGR